MTAPLIRSRRRPDTAAAAGPTSGPDAGQLRAELGALARVIVRVADRSARAPYQSMHELLALQYGCTREDTAVIEALAAGKD